MVANANKGRTISYGTCLMVYGTEDFVVAAADSRRNTAAGHEDRACKILCLDEDTIFLCQGIVEGWGSNARDEARGCFARAQEDLYRLAGSWGRADACKPRRTKS